MLITLTPLELALGALCGCARNRHSVNLPDAHGFDDMAGWNKHIEGACGEMACAKCLGRYWCPTVNTFKDPDIRCLDLGFDLQVRTRIRHDWELYLRPGENLDHAWVLVTGKAPDFQIRGYRFGHDIKAHGRWDDPGGRPHAWFMPADQLWPWEDLKIGGKVRA